MEIARANSHLILICVESLKSLKRKQPRSKFNLEHVADTNEDKSGNHIAAVNSYFIEHHPNCLQTSGHNFSLVFHSLIFTFNL